VKLTVIIPAFNEANFLERVVEAALGQTITGIDSSEVIIVDDGSTDGTGGISAAIAEKNAESVRVFHHTKNLGKGAAIRTGICHANGDILLIQDADLEYQPSDYSKLIQPIIAGVADVVYGSRFCNSQQKRVFGFGIAR
jgi:glycosyltransferase involved in cell wall biosynthesis